MPAKPLQQLECQQNHCRNWNANKTIAETGEPAKPLQTLEWWCRWHAAWQERCQALERLRVCISRKRISFRLFKQWYWESFDDDVQVPALTHHLSYVVLLFLSLMLFLSSVLPSVACCVVIQLWRASLHGASSKHSRDWMRYHLCYVYDTNT